MYHEYPYTTYFHDIDKLCRACHDAGYKLLVDANSLKLLNKNDEVVSTVVIHYAETALADVDGKNIKTYLFNAATDTDELILTKGDGSTVSLTIPYATKAEKDKLNKDLTSYVYEVQASGDKIQIVKGDSTVTEITVPFATKALTDINGKDIKTYAATMVVDGDYIVLKDSTGSELARLTAPYAIKAFGDDDGDTFTTTYAATLEAGTTTVVLKAKDGNTLSTITVPYATKALTDNNGNAFLHDYAEKIVVDGDGKRIGLEAHDGTRLATITVPFATLATDATNAVETISVVGDQLVFTTYGGQAYSITAPYAVKAQKDDAGNTIKSTYIAAVTNDAQTGKLIFKDATGQTIVEITPTVSRATYDSYNNLIADYVKSILASASSDYVTVTHGDGDVEQITINYSTHAWKDTNENVIKNTYIKRLACVEDVQDHHYKLVAYNGDTPEAELFRIELIAYEAQRAIGDKNGTDITTYVHDVTIDASTKEVVVKDGTNTEKARFKAGGTQLKYDDQGTLTDIDEAELGTGLEYDDTTDTINCIAESGTKVYSPVAGGTPTHSIEILGSPSVAASFIELDTPSDAVLDGTAATDFSEFDSFTNSLSVGDFISLDLSAISTQVETSLSGSSFQIQSINWNGLVTVNAGYDQSEFIDHGCVAILEVTEVSWGAQCRMLYASELYPQLYIGSHLYVRDNTLNADINNIVHTRFATSSYDLDQDEQCYKFTDFTATDAANAGVGTMLYVEHGTNLSIYIATGLSSIIPRAPLYMNARNDYLFIKVAAPNEWKLLKIYRPSSNEYFSSIDFMNAKNFLLHMLDIIELMDVKYKDSNYPVPTLRPADSSGNVLPYEYWAYAENENRRIEVFMFSGTPNYDKFRVVTPRAFVPLAASGNNNVYSDYEDTLYPLYYDGTYYKTITTMPIINDAIAVVYEKAAPVNYLGN